MLGKSVYILYTTSFLKEHRSLVLPSRQRVADVKNPLKQFKAEMIFLLLLFAALRDILHARSFALSFETEACTTDNLRREECLVRNLISRRLLSFSPTPWNYIRVTNKCCYQPTIFAYGEATQVNGWWILSNSNWDTHTLTPTCYP